MINYLWRFGILLFLMIWIFVKNVGEWKYVIMVARKTRLAVIAYVMILVNRIVEKTVNYIGRKGNDKRKKKGK